MNHWERCTAALAGAGLWAALTFVGVTGCDRGAVCGDGAVDADETCDDGNQRSGDGCSASCEPDDDDRTPGDDRVGYFWCAPDALSPGVTCPPDALCCLTDGPRCATHEEGCTDPFNVTTCDGPEDCGPVARCETASHDRTCRSNGIVTSCHTDRDCAGVVDWQPQGECTPAGVCTFGEALAR